MSFSPAVSYPSGGGGPGAIATGDFNADGRSDVAVAIYDAAGVGVLLSGPQGALGPAAAYPAGNAPLAVKAADFDGNGADDLAIACFGADRVAVLLSNGSGSFGAAVNYAAGDGPRDLVAGRFNADPHLDLVVVSSEGANSSAWLLAGSGQGAFAPAVPVAAGPGAWAVSAGDWNRDGHLDVAVVNVGVVSSISILHGNGLGQFFIASTVPTAGAPRSIASADFDGDGHADLALSGEVAVIAVHFGGAGGVFGTPVTLPSSPFTNNLTAGDFNRDSFPDLAYTGSTLRVVLGDGAGNFAAPLSLASANASTGIAAGDFDQDGDPDLVVALPAVNRIGVHANTCTSPPHPWFDPASACGGTLSATVGVPVTFTVVAHVASTLPANAAVLSVSGAPAAMSHVPPLPNSAVASPLATIRTTATWTPTAADIGTRVVTYMVADQLAQAAACTVTIDVAFVTSGCIAPAFAPGSSLAVGPNVNRVTIADLDQDGHADLIVPFGAVAFTNTQVAVFPGDGSGTFGPPALYSVGVQPRSSAVADFNHDGHRDLVVSNRNHTGVINNVSVLLGNAGGTLNPAVNYSIGARPEDVVTADFNQDGHPDIATANFFNNAVAVLEGNGAGGFTGPLAYSAGSNASGIITADFNRDGRPDLAVSNEGSDDVRVLLRSATGFQPAQAYSVTYPAHDLAAGDLDEDGNLDLAVAAEGPGNTPILLGDGAGGFTLAGVVALGVDSPRSVALGDFNLDGHTDLAVTGVSSAELAVALGDGNGGFAPPVSYATGSDPLGVTVGDLHADGRADVVVARSPGSVTIFRNTCPSFTAPAPPGRRLLGSFGLPMAFEVGALSGTGLPGDAITLSAGNVPPGAVHAPALPSPGNQGTAASMFHWTPASGASWSNLVTYAATNQLGDTAICNVHIDIASCFLMFGLQPVAIPMPGGPGTLLTSIDWIQPVNPLLPPTFTIPADPSLTGVSVYAQLLMQGPALFPNDPFRFSHGLRLILGLSANGYGNGGWGIFLTTLGPPTLGGEITFAIQVPGV